MNAIVYLIKGEDLIGFIDTNKRKSLPLSFLEEKAFVIKERLNPSIDYLNIIDQIYFKE